MAENLDKHRDALEHDGLLRPVLRPRHRQDRLHRRPHLHGRDLRRTKDQDGQPRNRRPRRPRNLHGRHHQRPDGVRLDQAF